MTNTMVELQFADTIMLEKLSLYLSMLCVLWQTRTAGSVDQLENWYPGVPLAISPTVPDVYTTSKIIPFSLTWISHGINPNHGPITYTTYHQKNDGGGAKTDS